MNEPTTGCPQMTRFEKHASAEKDTILVVLFNKDPFKFVFSPASWRSFNPLPSPPCRALNPQSDSAAKNLT
jgi:hypothetical protein